MRKLLGHESVDGGALGGYRVHVASQKVESGINVKRVSHCNESCGAGVVVVLFRTGPGAPHHVVSRGSDPAYHAPEGDLHSVQDLVGWTVTIHSENTTSGI